MSIEFPRVADDAPSSTFWNKQVSLTAYIRLMIKKSWKINFPLLLISSISLFMLLERNLFTRIILIVLYLIFGITFYLSYLTAQCYAINNPNKSTKIGILFSLSWIIIIISVAIITVFWS
jgi:hypothetical protein